MPYVLVYNIFIVKSDVFIERLLHKYCCQMNMYHGQQSFRMKAIIKKINYSKMKAKYLTSIGKHLRLKSKVIKKICM